jgi:hypothetical protein
MMKCGLGLVFFVFFSWLKHPALAAFFLALPTLIAVFFRGMSTDVATRVVHHCSVSFPRAVPVRALALGAPYRRPLDTGDPGMVTTEAGEGR